MPPRENLNRGLLYEVLSRRFADRDKGKPWDFWHTYVDVETGEKKAGPFKDRRKIIKNLCNRAKVRHFRFQCSKARWCINHGQSERVYWLHSAHSGS